MSEKQCFTPEGEMRDDRRYTKFNLSQDPYPNPDILQEQGETYIRISKERLEELKKEAGADDCENPSTDGMSWSVLHENGKRGAEVTFRNEVPYYLTPESRAPYVSPFDDPDYDLKRDTRQRLHEEIPHGATEEWISSKRPTEEINERITYLEEQGYETSLGEAGYPSSSMGNEWGKATTVHHVHEPFEMARPDPDKELYENGEGLDQVTGKWVELFGENPESGVFYRLPQINGGRYDKDTNIGETLIIRGGVREKTVELKHVSPNYPKLQKLIKPGETITENDYKVTLGTEEYPLFNVRDLIRAESDDAFKPQPVSIGYDISYTDKGSGESFEGVAEYDKRKKSFTITRIHTVSDGENKYFITSDIRQIDELNLDPQPGDFVPDFVSNADSAILIPVGDDTRKTLTLLSSLGNQFDKHFGNDK